MLHVCKIDLHNCNSHIHIKRWYLLSICFNESRNVSVNYSVMGTVCIQYRYVHALCLRRLIYPVLLSVPNRPNSTRSSDHLRRPFQRLNPCFRFPLEWYLNIRHPRRRRKCHCKSPSLCVRARWHHYRRRRRHGHVGRRRLWHHRNGGPSHRRPLGGNHRRFTGDNPFSQTITIYFIRKRIKHMQTWFIF